MLLVLTLLACHLGTTAGEKVSTDPDPVKVERYTVAEQAMPEVLPLAGSIVADRQVQVAADTNGVVARILVERGQSVRRGEVLAVIDPKVSALSADASSAQAALAQAQAELADKDCTRSEQLFKDGVISQAQIERTRTQCEAQKRALDAARASAAIASNSRNKTQVRAPFDGVVGERSVEVGAFVSAASPVLTLYTEGGSRVRFPVPERYVALVKQDARVDFYVTALPEHAFVGAVKYISPALREQTRDLVIEALPEDPDGLLKPGMFANVRLTTADTPLAVVPDGAIRKLDTANHIFSIREGRAFDQVVRVGVSRDGFTAVLSDLKVGDEVVAAPPETLRDGQRVE